MARDPNIPLFLWVAAAIVAHLVWGGGAEQAAEVFEERADMRRFAASVQEQLRRRFSTEIALLDDTTAELLPHDAQEPPPVPDAPADEKPADKVEPPKQPVPDKPAPDDVPAPERERLKAKVKPEQAKPKEEVKPKPEPEAEKKQKAPEVPQEKAQAPQRVAVVQHVEDKNQADNAEAEFLGDDNNRVQEQTQ